MIATLMAIATAVSATSYDCVAEQQVALVSEGDNWSSNSQRVSRDQSETFSWTFVVTRDEDGAIRVEHDPGILDALGLGGQYDAFSIAEGQFAFSTFKGRNCMLTELACGTLVEISDINDREAIFSITPTGSIRQNDGSREVFQLIMLGTCSKTEVTE